MGDGWFKRRAFAACEFAGRTYKPLQAFFGWNFSGGLILFFYGLSIGMIGLATYFSDADYFFNWAYVFAALGGIWSLGYWLTSPALENKRKRTRRQIRGLDPYSRRPYVIILLGGFLLIVTVFAGICDLIHATSFRKRLQSNNDYLVAGDDPIPDNACSVIPNGALRILLGPMAAWSTWFPTNVISLNGEPILSLEKTQDGRVAISTDIYDRHHDIVAEIDHNKYDVDSSVFKMSRKSLSDLSVYVRHDKEQVLNIQYLNPTTISMTGVFRTKTAELRVTQDDVYLNGKKLGHLGICSGNNYKAAFAFNAN